MRFRSSGSEHELSGKRVRPHASDQMIGFLHTAEVHVETFDRLVAERGPGRTTTSLVDEDLLATARTAGIDDASLVRRVLAALHELEAAGASVIVCTCSTIAGLTERLGDSLRIPVVRIDRPMAELAVAAGPRIAVVAALDSTIAPTVPLLREVAAAAGLEVTIDAHLIDGAWTCFEAGDAPRYEALVADACAGVAGATDVIVLAQASMAGAVPRLAADFPIPVLSSPGPAVDAALRR